MGILRFTYLTAIFTAAYGCIAWTALPMLEGTFLPTLIGLMLLSSWFGAVSTEWRIFVVERRGGQG